MSTARNEIVAALADLEELEDYRVVAYARSMTIAQPTVMVQVNEVLPAAGLRDYKVTLIVAVPETDPTGPADDTLDDALEDVLHALDVHGAAVGVMFERAARATLDDAYLAYGVEVNSRRTKES